MRKGIRRAVAVAGLAALALLGVVSTPVATAETAPETVTQQQSGLRAVYGPSPEKLAAYRAAGLDDPPFGECWFTWEAGWPAGNPVPIDYSAGVACGPSWGPEMSLHVKASLEASWGSIYDVGPDVHNKYGESEIASESTAQNVWRPTSVRVHHQSSALFLPDHEGQVDVWYYLPAGCIGVGSPYAECDFRGDTLNL
jgi:hypothetical protein